MNKCYQCKESLDLALKMRSLLFSEEEYCPSCGAELNFSLFWSVFCILFCTVAGWVIAAYLNDIASAPGGDRVMFMFGGLLFGLLSGWFFAAAFFPLIPPPVDDLAQIEHGIIAVFSFGFICMICLIIKLTLL